MGIWSKARSFSQEAAKRYQELTMEAAKRSQEISIGGSRLTDIVSEASKRSMEFAAEASKHADLIKLEALKRADQIKSLYIIYSPSSPSASSLAPSAEELQTFGVIDDLRDFVKEITLNTFKNFPLPGCSKLISCKENTATQDIHYYGAMLIVALVALLLIIYNCSDQIITIRERRRAKSREKAARFVRESEQARGRWKYAIGAAMKRADRLQAGFAGSHG